MKLVYYVVGADEPQGPWHVVSGPHEVAPMITDFTKGVVECRHIRIEQMWEWPF